jgi:putative ABC transport system permease protein
LYPPDFRDEMGDALVETYRDRATEAFKTGGTMRLARVWFAALRDSVRNGLGERARPAVSWRRNGDWGRDMELVLRRFRQKPMFVIAALTTLTVGLSIFAVVFTAVDKILIESLPYKGPGDLYEVHAEFTNLKVSRAPLSGLEVSELQKAGGPIQDAAGTVCGNSAIPSTDNRDAYHIYSMGVTPNLFDVLGVHPELGRTFRPEDSELDNNVSPIMLSDAMWKRLGGNPEIAGTKLRIGADTHDIIGVMPANFDYSCSTAQTPDVFYPLDIKRLPPGARFLLTVVRARPGTSPSQLDQAIRAVGSSIVSREPASFRSLNLRSSGLQADLVKEIRPALVALGFAGIFVLLVLTVNLASLLLARASEREKEFAVSRALGANGPAVVRATLLEGGLLGLVGGIAGMLVGIWGTRLLVTLGPLDLPRRATIALDSRIAAVVVLAGSLLGLIAATVPAVWSVRVSLAALISGAAVRGGASSGRMRRSLIVVQVALSIVLLSAGGLVVRSFEQLLAAKPGFKPEGVLTLRLSTRVLTKPADVRAFHERTTAALKALPDVTGVSAATNLPLSDSAENITKISFPDAPGNTGQDQDSPVADMVFTHAGYVETMGIPLLTGRPFEEARHEGVREALIDRHLAEQFFPNRSPIGATMQFDKFTATVVGVMEQARLHHLYQDGRPLVFVRAEDYPLDGYRFYVIRTNGDPRALISGARAVVRQIERRIPVSMMRTMDDIVADARSRERISAVLIGSLALGALLLVAMGLFGMISGSVARRRGELAVRLALGATHQRVIRLVVGEGARLVALGLLIAVPGIYLAGEALKGFLIGVSPFDFLTLAAVSAGLVGVALLACYLAARRVTTIEPDRLLREG